MDPLTLLPWIGPLVAALAAYVKEAGVRLAADKAAETVGEHAGGALAGAGSQAFALLKRWFARKADPKAQQALANVVQDPDDADYQQKLAKETARLAAADPQLVQALKMLAQHTAIQQSSSVTITNNAASYGVQGVFYAPITINQKDDTT